MSCGNQNESILDAWSRNMAYQTRTTAETHIVEFTVPEGPSARRPLVYIWHEPGDTGYTVEVASLPGCLSQGETIAECLERIKEALLGLLEMYRADGVPVPWQQRRDPPREFLWTQRVIDMPEGF